MIRVVGVNRKQQNTHETNCFLIKKRRKECQYCRDLVNMVKIVNVVNNTNVVNSANLFQGQTAGVNGKKKHLSEEWKNMYKQ